MRMTNVRRSEICNLLVGGLRPAAISERLGIHLWAVHEVETEMKALGASDSESNIEARRKLIEGLDIRISPGSGGPPKVLATGNDVVYTPAGNEDGGAAAHTGGID